MNNNTNDNLLKTLTETHTVIVKDVNFRSAINMMMYKLRSKISENEERVILKMEIMSFSLDEKKELPTGGKLLSAINKGKNKIQYTATIGVEIKYLDVEVSL